MDEVRSFQASVRDHVNYVARIDGGAVGSAVGAILPQRADRVFTIVTVLAGQRHQGAGSALYAAISAWTARRGLSEIEVPVLDNDPESLAFAQRRGFVQARRELGVVLRLAEIAVPEIEPPDGVEIITWADRPELAHDMQGSGDRAEATFVAIAGEDVVGYAKFSLTAAQPTIAHHDLSAVKRAWRGRGVARALKAAQINWALANGYTELHTRNEVRNEPIRRLNARLGYRPGIGCIYLTGPISGS